MKKKINVYWYKVKKGYGNFGDELNCYLIQKLSGKKIRRIIVPSSGLKYVSQCFRLLKYKMISITDIFKLINQYFINDFIVAIGSVISIPNSKNAKIWGSGIIKSNDIINESKFYAVRGKYTQKRLLELGFIPPKALGDPAILLPLVYKPNNYKKFKLGIIPHYIHLKTIKDTIINNEILIIDLTDKIEDVIDSINSCEYTISTSLHGIIVSHVYNIPSLWFDFGGDALFGDDIKFNDYFSSVNIKEYKPFHINAEVLQIHEIINLFESNIEINKINCDLLLLQRGLIESAPFYIIDKYKK